MKILWTLVSTGVTTFYEILMLSPLKNWNSSLGVQYYFLPCSSHFVKDKKQDKKQVTVSPFEESAKHHCKYQIEN